MAGRIRQLWCAFLSWKGWTAWLHWPVWKAIGRWPGWRRLFRLPPLLLIPLSILSGAGLAAVFLTGQDTHWTAAAVYALSAYTLTAVMVCLPSPIRRIRQAILAQPLIHRYLEDKALRFSLSLYREQFINALYGIFKTVSGVLHGSAWIGADGIYNLVQSVIQLVQILRRKQNLSLMHQWKSYRLCGWLTLLLLLTITGPAFQMIRMGRAEEYPGYLIFVTALFCFYKLISAIVDLAKDRKNKAPIDSAVRLLSFSQALFSLFCLQAAMLRQFGGTAEFALLMNSLTGCGVCLLTAAMGVYMLRRSRREMKKLEESTNV